MNTRNSSTPPPSVHRATGKSFWRAKIRMSWLLTIVCSIGALVWLNRVTAGTGEHCSWSFFGIWEDEIGYIRESSTPLYDIWYLITGGGSVGLWLYTFMHVIPAVILGWTLAAVISAGWMLVKRKGKREGASGIPA